MTRHWTFWMIAFAACLATGPARAQSLIPDTNPVDFSEDAGSTNSQTTTVNVAASSGTLSFTATASTTSGGNWLTVCLTPTCPLNSTSVSTDTDNGQLTIEISPPFPGLQVGTYNGTIALACVPSSACAPVSISVVLQVSGVIVTATPNQVTISVPFGQSTTTNVTLGGNANLGISVPTGGAWLSAPANLDTPATLTLNIDAAGLAVGGPYPGSVLLQCVSGSPCQQVPISVALTVMPPALMAAPTVPLNGFGRGTPVSATVFVSSSSGGALNFTSTPSTTSGGSWLSVGLSPTTTPQTLTIQANPANLDVGSYTGTITLACASSTPCTGTTITVNLTVQPGITVSPSPLTLTATHSNQVVSSNLTITSLVTGGLPFTVACSTSSGGPWLGCALSGSATTSGTPYLVAISSGEMVGNTSYHGTLAITGGGTTINVPVTFQLQGAQLTVNPPTLNFTVPAGEISLPQNVFVAGAAGLLVSLQGSGDTLVSLPGFIPKTFQVNFDASHNYLGPTNLSFNLMANCGDNCFDAVIPVQVTVTAPPYLNVTPTTLSAFSVAQGNVSASQSVNVTSSDGTSVPFVATGPSWVTLNVGGGTATGVASPVSISVNAQSLPAGQTSGTVTVTCNTAFNPILGRPGLSCPSILMPITANVTAGAHLTANPASVTITAYQGRSVNPPVINVTASDGSAMPFTISGVPSWLAVGDLFGTTPYRLGFTPIPNPPTAPGTASVTLTPSSNATTPVVIPVTLTVSPFTISASPSPLPISVVAGQVSQPANLGITTIDGASAQVNVAVTGSPILPTLSSASITAPGNISVTVDATHTAAGSYSATVTLTCGAANPCAPVQVPVQITVTSGPQAPVITPSGIVPIYSSSTTIQPGSWISIYGSNLASSPVTWTGNFPTSLGGTTVTIDNKPAYINFVAPNQIDVQAPDDVNLGTVPVVITTSTGTTTSTVTLGQYGPSFCVAGGKYIAGIVLRNDGSGTQGEGTYDFIGPNGTSFGYPTRPVKANDVVELFGVGFGPVNPPIPAGQVVPVGTYGTATKDIEFVIGGITVKPDFAGITEAGLFQFNVTIPAGIGSGDVAITATVGGLQTPANIFIAAQ